MTPTALAEGRYRVESTLGLGGMAVVYRAHDDMLDRQVAVKVLDQRVLADPELRARFVREAKLAARLTHPNIVAVFDTGEDDGLPYIVMECVPGGTLDAQGPLPPDQVEAILRQACAGLAHAHAAGIVHRDVKPQNLLLREDGTLKISDFGIARAAHETAITQAGSLLGTLSYLAPEVAAGAQATECSDMYGLGAVAYELLTGRPPKQIGSLADLMKPHEVAELGGGPLERLVMRCVAADPAERPSAQDVLAELGGAPPVHATAASAAAGDTVVLRPVAQRRRLWPALITAAVVLAGGVVAGLVAFGGDGGSGTPAAVAPVPRGATPEQDARNIAAWLREHSR
jgi:serine/threonine protein kinase